MNKATTEAPAQVVDWNELLQQVQTPKDLAAFLRHLLDHLRTKPEEWENDDLPSFLDAVASWTEDMDGYFQNRGEAMPDQPTWRTLGQILLAARVYE